MSEAGENRIGTRTTTDYSVAEQEPGGQWTPIGHWRERDAAEWAWRGHASDLRNRGQSRRVGMIRRDRQIVSEVGPDGGLVSVTTVDKFAWESGPHETYLPGHGEH